MKVLITGHSGLIGRAIKARLAAEGHEMLLAGRGEPKSEREIRWDSETGFADEDISCLEGLDAVIHLAGENIFALRWTDEKKKAIRDSRVHGTRNLVTAFSGLEHKPAAFVSASAVGFYGDRGDDIMTETEPSGDTFLAEVTRDWEAEARRAEDSGIRTVLMRSGIVLSKDGGALSTMLTPFKLGVGGVIGSGKQWMSWISLEDIVELYIDGLTNEGLRGAVNAVSPQPVTNETFTKVLGDVLYRPTFIPLPEFAINLVFGEMGHELLLSSTRVVPKRLQDKGFRFKFPELREALESAVK